MTVSTSTAKAGPYAGSGTTGPFTVPFRFLENSHLRVIKTSTTGVETDLVLTTDYTVSGAGSASGTVTLTSPLLTGEKLTILRNVPLTQDADYVAGDAFPAETHERALDKLTMITQQLREEMDRAVKLPPTSSESTEELVADLQRIADSADNLDAVANNITGVNTVGADITKVSAVADAIGNVNAVAANVANVNAVAGVSANVTTVANNITKVNTVAGAIGNVNTVAANVANVNTVAGVSANVTTVANSAANVATVAGAIGNVNAVGTDITKVNTVAGAIGNVNTVAANVANVNAVATNATNINTVANNITGVSAVGTDISKVNTVAGVIGNVNTVAGAIGNVNTVATNVANVNAVGANITNVNTVAANITDVTNYADTYLGPKASPPTTRNDGSALQAGDLYFNTTTDTLYVYDGTAWSGVTSSNIGPASETAAGLVELATAAEVQAGTDTVRAVTPAGLAAAGATKLRTARTINGTSFDGSANITTASWGTARTITIGNTSKTVDGSANVSWTLAEIGASAASAASVTYQPAGTGAVATTVETKLRELPSVKDFSSPAVADATGSTLFVPNGSYSSGVANGGALTARYWGPGQIVTADGNRRGKWFSAVTAAPASTGNHNSVDTAFNGDLSRSHFQIEHRVTGAATLGQPSTGYKYTPEAMPNYTYLYNSSGWNQATNGNAGRTGIAAYRAKVDQYGQGDAVAFNASVFVTGTRSGSTHWLANPAGVLFNGDMTAGANGVYFNPREIILDDAGYDVAAIGDVVNMKRTNNTGAKSTVWTAARYQSVGTKPVDNIISATGMFTVGLDFSMSGLSFGTNKAAISLKAGDRIYLNNAATASGQLTADWRTTVFNGDYIDYSSGGINIAVGGSYGLSVSTTEVYAYKRLKMLQSFDVVSSGNIASTVGAAGSASPLPAAPLTYLIIKLDGTNYKIPVYNA